MVHLLGENRIGTIRIDVQLMRELSTHLVIAQRCERGVAGLTGSFPAPERIGGRRSYFSRAKTYAAKQISDSTRQPGDSIHRLHNHISGAGYMAYRACSLPTC